MGNLSVRLLPLYRTVEVGFYIDGVAKESQEVNREEFGHGMNEEPTLIPYN